jgi:hypothetical protein
MKWQSGVQARHLKFCTVIIAAGCLAAAAQAQQQRPPQKPTVTLPSLTAQGFEIKAALGSSLVLQKGKDVWLCDMLTIRSSCTAAE